MLARRGLNREIPSTSGTGAQLVEVCWRMRSRQNPANILQCVVWRTDTGLEVRVGYGLDYFLYVKAITDVFAGREVAATLREPIIAIGGFDEIPVDLRDK